MKPLPTSRQIPTLLLALVFAKLASSVKAQQSSLGQVDFPTSGSQQAQAHFLRGVAALHSFWYEEALDAFRESTKVEPTFMMGYWGEAMALDVFQKQPNHPGAAHYIIHAFGDPEHAILALPAARRYALIAPEAHHARHMPSHIFLQLGMWPEAAAANESSWATSDAWVKRKNLPLRMRDYHSLQWLQYIYLQQGRYSKAEDLLATVRKDMAEFAASSKPGPNRFADSYTEMVAAFLVET